MRKIITAKLIATCTLYLHVSILSSHYVQQQQNYPLTSKIFEQFYYIKRLTKTLHFINTTALTKQHKVFTALKREKLSCSHPLVIDIIEEISTKCSMEPIKRIWLRICSYSLLDDELFFDDFTKLLVIVYKTLLQELYRHRVLHTNIHEALTFAHKALSTPIPLRIEYLDILTHYTENIARKRTANNFLWHIPKPFHELVYTDSIAHRYYLIERLAIGQVCLSRYEKSLTGSFYTEIEKVKGVFRHERIIACVRALCTHHTLQNYIQLCDDYRLYKYIDDEQCTREIVLLTFISLKALVHLVKHGENTHVKMSTVIEDVMHHLESLPLDQLLQAIDALSFELLAISNRYELMSNIPWKDWFKRYWWAPPLIATTIGIKLFIIIKLVRQSSHASSV